MNASQPGNRVHKTTRGMLDVRGFIPVTSSKHSASRSPQTRLELTQPLGNGYRQFLPQRQTGHNVKWSRLTRYRKCGTSNHSPHLPHMNACLFAGTYGKRYIMRDVKIPQ